MYYCCSINLKRQLEHSGLRPDTRSLVSFSIVMILFHKQLMRAFRNVLPATYIKTKAKLYGWMEMLKSSTAHRVGYPGEE